MQHDLSSGAAAAFRDVPFADGGLRRRDPPRVSDPNAEDNRAREVRAAAAADSAIAAVAIPLIKHEKHRGLGERRPKDRRSLANQESARERNP